MRNSQAGPVLKTVVLATANKRETSAVFDVLKSTTGNSDPKFVGRDTNLPRYESTFSCINGNVRLAITQADETGGDEAVDLLKRIVEEVDPDAVFFVGCAALLDEKEKIEPNTVYLARRGYDSDNGELRNGQATYDMDQHPGDLRVRRVFSQLGPSGFFEPVNLVTNRDFISGSVFLADRNAQRRHDLVGRYPADAVVLEMETFAVYKELFRLRTYGWQGSVSVIKGISDVGDENAQIGKEKSQRLATKNAATVIMQFLNEVGG